MALAYAHPMTCTPEQALAQLQTMAADGRLDELCDRLGIGLLVAFGSAATGPPPASDLDLAVRLHPGRDLVVTTSALIAELHCDDIDVLDLDRAGIAARAAAFTNAVPLFEDEVGAYSRAAMAALAMAADTAWIRDLEIDRLAS